MRARRGGRRPGARPREDRGDRAAPRHRPDRARVRARLRAAARRARLDGRARRAQRRRRRHERRGDGRSRCGGSRTSAAASSPSTAREVARRAAAAGRRPALGRAARGGRRAQPRARRGGARARLHDRGAVPAARVPRALGDPEPEADRPRPRRRRPLRARAAGDLADPRERLDRDDGRRRHASTSAAGCGSRTGSSPSVGAGDPPGRRGEDLARRGRHARASSTPTTTSTRRSRAPGRRRPTSSPGCGRSTRSGRGSTTRWSTPPRARGLAELALSGCSTVFDHHYVFPRGVSGLVEAELQAPRELGVRIVASRGSMDLGDSDGGLPPDSLVEEIDAILADTERLAALADGDMRPDRRRAVLAVLGHDAADGGVGRARPAARPAAAHPPRRDGRGGGVLPRALRLHAGRVPRARRLARRATSGARTASTSRRREVERFARARRRRRALPDVEPPPRRRHRAGARAARRGRARRARRRRLARRTSAATSSSR